MSRQNKVNPGMYTQRGRLTQDDAARELAKQRSVGSEHTWQPVQRDAQPRLTSKTEGDDAATADQVDETRDEKPVRVTAKVKPARKMAPRKTAPRKTASRKTASRKTANARATTKAGAKKTTASSMKVKAKSARTNTTKAKSARRRKS